MIEDQLITTKEQEMDKRETKELVEDAFRIITQQKLGTAMQNVRIDRVRVNPNRVLVILTDFQYLTLDPAAIGSDRTSDWVAALLNASLEPYDEDVRQEWRMETLEGRIDELEAKVDALIDKEATNAIE